MLTVQKVLGEHKIDLDSLALYGFDFRLNVTIVGWINFFNLEEMLWYPKMNRELWGTWKVYSELKQSLGRLITSKLK